MKWKSLLLFLCPLMAFSAPKKNLHLSYVVSSNDVGFYMNQPIWLKVSVCEKKEQLCTEATRSAPFTLTKNDKAFHFVLVTDLTAKAFNAIILKRRIAFEDAKIKFEVIYSRTDIFSKFVQGIYFYKDLVSRLPGDRILKDSVSSEKGLVEVSYLLTN